MSRQVVYRVQDDPAKARRCWRRRALTNGSPVPRSPFGVVSAKFQFRKHFVALGAVLKVPSAMALVVRRAAPLLRVKKFSLRVRDTLDVFKAHVYLVFRTRERCLMDKENKLKNIRMRFGMKQKDIAEELHTTQQTVARWETGITAIPTAHLKELAVLFGCSSDEILGIRQSSPQRVTAVENSVPWGTLKVRFSGRVQADGSGENGDNDDVKNEKFYPIDEGVREQLRRTLHGEAGLTELKGWLEFPAMDNRLVLLNPTFVTRLRWVSDDVDKMPYWASPITYRDLMERIPGDELGPKVREERDEVIRQLTGISDGAPTNQQADQAVIEMRSVKLIYANGWEEKFFLNDDTATSVYYLRQEIDTVGSNTFIWIGEHKDQQVSINCSSIAAIEVPWEAYSDYLDKDQSEAEATMSA